MKTNKIRSVISAVFPLILLLVLSACHQIPMMQDRPGDGSEGVPGYIIDPSFLIFSRASGKITISAPAGTLASGSSKVGDLLIEFWNPSYEEVSKINSNEVKLAFIKLGEVVPKADGSFRATVKFKRVNDIIAVSVSSQAAPAQVTLPVSSSGKATVVFMDLNKGGKFQSLTFTSN